MKSAAGLTGLVRAELRRRGGDCPYASVAQALGWGATYDERKRVKIVLNDLAALGEAVRVAPGVYRHSGAEPPLSVRQRLWDVIRRWDSAEFVRADLAQITGAKKASLDEFLAWLVAAGFAERLARGHYRRRGQYAVSVPVDDNKRKRRTRGKVEGK